MNDPKPSCQSQDQSPTKIPEEPYLCGVSYLGFDSLIAPVRGIDDLVDAILDAFHDSVYRFLDREELAQHLPAHITPDEYCMCAEPWDRVFHVLFANTD